MGIWYRDQYGLLCQADAASPTTITASKPFAKLMASLLNLDPEDYAGKMHCTPTALNCEKASDRYKKEKDPTTLQYINYPNVLFNLYPIRYFTLGTNFTSIPELTLRNTKATYFINNIDSLITIWEDEGVDLHNIPNYLLIDRENKGGKINIENCYFDYSRFCKGLIAYNYWHYKYNSANWQYYSEPNIQKADEGDLKYYINIKGSQFNRLNILNMREQAKTLSLSGSFEVIHPTESVKLEGGAITVDYTLYKILHKGIVLNLQGFPGSVYISDSQFLYVYIYIYIYIYI